MSPEELEKVTYWLWWLAIIPPYVAFVIDVLMRVNGHEPLLLWLMHC